MIIYDVRNRISMCNFKKIEAYSRGSTKNKYVIKGTSIALIVKLNFHTSMSPESGCPIILTLGADMERSR